MMLSEARKQAGRMGGGVVRGHGEAGRAGVGMRARERNGVPRIAGRVGAEMGSSWDGILRGGRWSSRARERRRGAGCAPQLSRQSL